MLVPASNTPAGAETLPTRPGNAYRGAPLGQVRLIFWFLVMMPIRMRAKAASLNR